MQAETQEMILGPAYGRDYKTASDVIKHWKDGKDFQIIGALHSYCGSYTSIRDVKTFLNGQAKIRYNKLADVVYVNEFGGSSTDDMEVIDIGNDIDPSELDTRIVPCP